MNDVQLGLDKLNDLVNAAEEAETEFEKAAVFAAASILLNLVETEAIRVNEHFTENVQRARHGIGAALGYDITNGHTKEMHISWASTAVMMLKRQFGSVN